MGFNFGAFLGGAASQIVEDIDEQEKEIKLRTRNILDRQVAQTLANQKEYKAKKEKVSNQLNALVPLFGDDPDALAKARSIVAGGDNHYNFMFNKLTQAQDRGQNVNEIYSLIPNKDAVGFKNVEDATNSLVKMAELPEIKLGETTGMAKLFGLDQKRFYEKERKILEEAGQIQSATANVPEKGVFAQGKLDLGKMKKAFKSSDEYEMSLINERDKFEPGSEKYIELDEKYKKFRRDRATTSANYITNEMINKNKKNPGAVSFRNFLSSYELKLKELEDQGEFLTIDGKQYSKRDPEYKAYVKQETDAYKKKFVENILNDVDGGVLNTNGMALIKANPDLQEIAIQIQKEQKDNIGKPDKKKPFESYDKQKADKLKAEQKKKLIEDFKKKYPSPESGIKGLLNEGKKKDVVLITLQQAFPELKEEDLVKMIIAAEEEKDRVLAEKKKQGAPDVI